VRAEQLTDAVAYHGEGPVWDAPTRRLLWVDMHAGDVLSTAPDGDTQRDHFADLVACVVPRKGGGYALATARGFTLVDPDGSLHSFADVWDDPTVRMNDGGCDPHGRFFCGSMATDAAAGRGAMYRLDPDGSTTQVFAGVTISNGLGWSPDGSQAFYVDTPTQRIDVCAPDLSSRRPFVSISSEVGAPDGLTVDAEGGVWVALWGGHAVHRYAPDGALDAVVQLPVAQVSSCAFGGDDLATLFITTSAENLADPEPAAGALFAVTLAVRGVPTLTFAG
jgi:sugar lactone lactonase YvrE